MKISCIYPNVSSILKRGVLLERWTLSEQVGCDLIEFPADFIKSEIKCITKRKGDYLGNHHSMS